MNVRLQSCEEHVTDDLWSPKKELEYLGEVSDWEENILTAAISVCNECVTPSSLTYWVLGNWNSFRSMLPSYTVHGVSIVVSLSNNLINHAL